MSVDNKEYFERYRNNLIFIYSLFLGIFGGTFFSIIFGEVLQVYFGSYYIYITFGLFLIFFMLSLWISIKYEKVKLCIQAYVNPEAFLTIYNTYENEIETITDEKFKHDLLALGSSLTNESILDIMSFEKAKAISGVIAKKSSSTSGSFQKFLKQINLMLNTIFGIQKHVVAAANNKQGIYESSNMCFKKNNNDIIIKKKIFFLKHCIWKQEMIKYTFLRNEKGSIFNPLRCHISINHLLEYEEFVMMINFMKNYLKNICSENSLLTIQLYFDLDTDIDIYLKSFKDLSDSIDKKIEDGNQKIDDIKVELKTMNEILNKKTTEIDPSTGLKVEKLTEVK